MELYCHGAKGEEEVGKIKHEGEEERGKNYGAKEGRREVRSRGKSEDVWIQSGKKKGMLE